jgi:hypothetical protein
LSPYVASCGRYPTPCVGSRDNDSVPSRSCDAASRRPAVTAALRSVDPSARSAGVARSGRAPDGSHEPVHARWFSTLERGYDEYNAWCATRGSISVASLVEFCCATRAASRASRQRCRRTLEAIAHLGGVTYFKWLFERVLALLSSEMFLMTYAARSSLRARSSRYPEFSLDT